MRHASHKQTYACPWVELTHQGLHVLDCVQAGDEIGVAVEQHGDGEHADADVSRVLVSLW
jgi:hypothetical protein